MTVGCLAGCSVGCPAGCLADPLFHAFFLFTFSFTLPSSFGAQRSRRQTRSLLFDMNKSEDCEEPLPDSTAPAPSCVMRIELPRTPSSNPSSHRTLLCSAHLALYCYPSFSLLFSFAEIHILSAHSRSILSPSQLVPCRIPAATISRFVFVKKLFFLRVLPHAKSAPELAASGVHFLHFISRKLRCRFQASCRYGWQYGSLVSLPNSLPGPDL